MAAHAEFFQVESALIQGARDDLRGTFDTRWVLLAKDPRSLRIGPIQSVKRQIDSRRVHWTDSRSSLLEVLNM